MESNNSQYNAKFRGTDLQACSGKRQIGLSIVLGFSTKKCLGFPLGKTQHRAVGAGLHGGPCESELPEGSDVPQRQRLQTHQTRIPGMLCGKQAQEQYKPKGQPF